MLAYYPGFSRLIACAVNERLVSATVITDAVLAPHSETRLFCYVTSLAQTPSLEGQGFLVKLNHMPQVCPQSNQVTFLHPKDCGNEAYVLTATRKDHSFELVSTYNLNFQKLGNEQYHASFEMNPLQLLHTLCNWQDVKDPTIRKQLHVEISSSLEHCEYALSYYATQPLPNLLSTALDWEQSIILGHATHPVSFI